MAEPHQRVEHAADFLLQVLQFAIAGQEAAWLNFTELECLKAA
jgi:hypothetical protein